MLPKKFASKPVNIIRGPAIAVTPPRSASTCLTGPGKFIANWTILSITVIKTVLIVKNCSPTSARDALSPSNALRYLPDADSVTAVNSRPATFAKSSEEAFIKSKTCNV